MVLHPLADTWSIPLSVQRAVGGNGVLEDTSPTAFTMTSTNKLVLLWTDIGTYDTSDGIWYSLYGRTGWHGQQSILGVIKDHALPDQSNCSGLEFWSQLYISWAGLEGGLWYTTRKTYDIITDQLEICTHIICQDFNWLHITHWFDDPEALKSLQEVLEKRYKLPGKEMMSKETKIEQVALSNRRTLIGQTLLYKNYYIETILP
jgi:hypothetical protein